jgi:hypothetical protein
MSGERRWIEVHLDWIDDYARVGVLVDVKQALEKCGWAAVLPNGPVCRFSREGGNEKINEAQRAVGQALASRLDELLGEQKLAQDGPQEFAKWKSQPDADKFTDAQLNARLLVGQWAAVEVPAE